jgi:hypothetical protein
VLTVIVLMSQLKGPNFATIDKPPNNSDFDGLVTAVVGQPSLLQQRAQAQNQKAQASGPVIHNHLNIPEGLLGLVGGNHHPQPVPVPARTDSVIPPGYSPGIRQSIADFCKTNDLADSILARFTEQKFTSTYAFRHMSVEDLKEVGFFAGEIADIREAVEVWAFKD